MIADAVASDPSPTCGALMFPNGIRCARTQGHDGKHNNVGEVIEWSVPLCWTPLTVNGEPRICIRDQGHDGPCGAQPDAPLSTDSAPEVDQ